MRMRVFVFMEIVMPLIPYLDEHKPNAETEAALREARKTRGKRYATLRDLLDDMDKESDTLNV